MARFTDGGARTGFGNRAWRAGTRGRLRDEGRHRPGHGIGAALYRAGPGLFRRRAHHRGDGQHGCGAIGGAGRRRRRARYRSHRATAAAYNLAAKGGLKITGGQGREVPGWQGAAILASNQAWDGGLKAYKDLANRTIGIVQVGGPVHYEVELANEKYHIDPKSQRLVALQGLSNVATALAGNQVDAAPEVSTFALKLFERPQGAYPRLGRRRDAVAEHDHLRRDQDRRRKEADDRCVHARL